MSLKREAPVPLAELDDSAKKTGKVEPAAAAASSTGARRSAADQLQQLADSLHRQFSIPTPE